MKSLWGEAFELPTTQEKAQKIVKKVEKQTESQKLKSKKTSIEDKLSIITKNVTTVMLITLLSYEIENLLLLI